MLHRDTAASLPLLQERRAERARQVVQRLASRVLLAAAMLFGIASMVIAQSPTPPATPPVYRDIKDLLLDTLAARDAIDATLQGPFAERFSQQFHATGALSVKSTVAERFENGRCGRIEAALTQVGARIEGEERAVSMTLRVALCNDGQPYRRPTP